MRFILKNGLVFCCVIAMSMLCGCNKANEKNVEADLQMEQGLDTHNSRLFPENLDHDREVRAMNVSVETEKPHEETQVDVVIKPMILDVSDIFKHGVYKVLGSERLHGFDYFVFDDAKTGRVFSSDGLSLYGFAYCGSSDEMSFDFQEDVSRESLILSELKVEDDGSIRAYSLNGNGIRSYLFQYMPDEDANTFEVEVEQKQVIDYPINGVVIMMDCACGGNGGCGSCHSSDDHTDGSHDSNDDMAQTGENNTDSDPGEQEHCCHGDDGVLNINVVEE